MKKHIFLIMALLSLSISTAQDFIVDNIAYNIVSGTSNVAVTNKAGYYSGSVTVPETVTNGATTYNVTAIEARAFLSSTDLTAVTIPNSIRSIGYQAFYATGLRTVSIPNSITTIERATFSNCASLETVDLPDSLTSLESSAFDTCLKLKTITLPNSLISIGANAFRACFDLETVNFGNSLMVIGENAFKRCIELKSISLPDSVTTIEEEAFALCFVLKTIDIGRGVTSIGDDAFNSCSNLSSVTIDVVTPIAISESVFDIIDLRLVALNVPVASESAYRAARVWQDFNPINGTLSAIDKNTLKDDDITIYPMPAKNTLNISLKNSMDLQDVSVLNLQGKVVKTTTESDVNISNLQSGMYILRLNTSQGVITKKVIKQ